MHTHTKYILIAIANLASSLGTVTMVTSRDIRKIVNKVFVVTVDNFDVGGVTFVIAAIVEVDSAEDHALSRRWMSSREPAVQMGSTSPSLPERLS